LVSNEILEKAASLFADRGFSNTSLQDVAKALGISRTALYHYIGGKEELLRALVQGLTRETAKSLETIAADKSAPALEKLEASIRSMVTRVAQNPARFRLLLMSEASLPEELASEHQTARRRTLRALTAVIREGIDAGEFRPVEERSAAFGIFGMCNWVAWWYQPDRADAPSPEQVADELSNMGAAALKSDSDRVPEDDATAVDHAIDLLRRDLDHLQRLVPRAVKE
jgi:AcrR family transcriptional regulator